LNDATFSHNLSPFSHLSLTLSYPRWDSNPHCSRSERDASCRWATRVFREAAMLGGSEKGKRTCARSTFPIFSTFSTNKRAETRTPIPCPEAGVLSFERRDYLRPAHPAHLLTFSRLLSHSLTALTSLTRAGGSIRTNIYTAPNRVSYRLDDSYWCVVFVVCSWERQGSNLHSREASDLQSD
jgi:hypothetical protein